MNQEVMNLFSPAVQPQAFDQIQISIASRRRFYPGPSAKLRSGDNQLPHVQTRTRMACFAPDFRRSRITSACAANTSG